MSNGRKNYTLRLIKEFQWWINLELAPSSWPLSSLFRRHLLWTKLSKMRRADLQLWRRWWIYLGLDVQCRTIISFSEGWPMQPAEMAKKVTPLGKDSTEESGRLTNRSLPSPRLPKFLEINGGESRGILALTGPASRGLISGSRCTQALRLRCTCST